MNKQWIEHCQYDAKIIREWYGSRPAPVASPDYLIEMGMYESAFFVYNWTEHWHYYYSS